MGQFERLKSTELPLRIAPNCVREVPALQKYHPDRKNRFGQSIERAIVRTLRYNCRPWSHSSVKATSITDVTRILSQIESGDPSAAEQLLPLVYEELRKLASVRMVQEAPGQTLQATALVHEAYLRLVASEESQNWDNRGHFFAAAAEAMRRILVDNARKRQRVKHGGDRDREVFDEATVIATEVPGDLLELDDALIRLESIDPRAAELVKLRYFAGLTIPEVANALGVSSRTADDIWAYARAWLFRELRGSDA